jgi:cytochrome c oxidase subunit 4
MSSAHSPADVKAEVRKYLYVFVSLMALTVVTVAVSYLHLEFTPAVILALIIASFKAFLVAGYFMHLINERRMVYALLVLTAVFFVVLMGLPLWHQDDPIPIG